MPKNAIATMKITQRIILVRLGLSITCFTPSFVASRSITVNSESSFFIKNTGLKKLNCSERVATCELSQLSLLTGTKSKP